MRDAIRRPGEVNVRLSLLRPFAATLILMMAACSAGKKDLIVGKWEVMKNTRKGKAKDVRDNEKFVEFTAKGEITISGKDGKVELKANYKFIAEDQIELSKEGEKEMPKLKILSISRNAMTLNEPRDDETVELTRIK